MIKEKLLGEKYKFEEGSVPCNLNEIQRKARKNFLDMINENTCFKAINKCPYCGNENFIKISEVDAKGIPCDIVLCDSCDGCFKATILSADANKWHYENNSYALRGKESTDDSLEKLFDMRVKAFAYPRYYFIRNFINLDPQNDLIVEIGCNDGANLAPWKENFFSVYGLDFDKRLVDFGNTKGLCLEKGDFLKKNFNAHKPRLIILSHLIEHVEDVNILMDWLKKELIPGGYIFVETPGIRSQGLGHPLKYFDVEHNYYFDLKSLERIASKHNFNLLYCDEYIRLIATLPQERAVPSHKKVAILSGNLSVNLARAFKKIFNVDNETMLEMLQKCEGNNLKIKLANKASEVYFSNFYSILAARGMKKYANRE